MFTYFGHKGEVSDPKTFFAEENYIICRNVTDGNDLDKLLSFYNKHIATSSQLYLRQNKQWETNNYTEYGGVSNAFLQPHCYQGGIQGDFGDRILRVAANPNIQQALTEISGLAPYNLAQTMFFDQKTTRPHQDWIYLDTKPNGHLIAAWIALENIPEDGIRFFVYPGTQNFQPQTSYNYSNKGLATFNDLLQEIDKVLETQQYQMYAPTLKKGDIFFWGSKIIHGSIAGTNPERRRRSLAAHFIPEGFKFGNISQAVEIEFAEKYNIKYRMLNYLNKDFAKHNPEQEQANIWKRLTSFLSKT